MGFTRYSKMTFGNAHCKQTFLCLFHVRLSGESEQELGVRYVVEGVQSLTAQPEYLGIVLIGGSKA